MQWHGSNARAVTMLDSKLHQATWKSCYFTVNQIFQCLLIKISLRSTLFRSLSFKFVKISQSLELKFHTNHTNQIPTSHTDLLGYKYLICLKNPHGQFFFCLNYPIFRKPKISIKERACRRSTGTWGQIQNPSLPALHQMLGIKEMEWVLEVGIFFFKASLPQIFW